MRQFIVNDEAEVTKPRLVDSHGFYVYEVDVSARLISVPDDLHLSARQLVELEDDELPEGVTVRSLPRPASTPTLEALAQAQGTTVAQLVAKYTSRVSMIDGTEDFIRDSLLAMLRELEGE